MANTINKLFPFSTLDPSKVKVCPKYLEFSAPVVDGKYVFSKATTPAQELGELPQEQTGVIAGVQISANCNADDFAAAVDAPLLLQVYHGGNNTPVNIDPFPFSQFSHGDNYLLNWKVTATDTENKDAYYIAVEGEVAQIGNMTENELILRVQFNFLRIEGDL